MKIKCNRNSLYKCVQLLSGIISNTTTKPILQNVKIEVNNNLIELFATDLEIGVRYFIDINNESNEFEDGIIIVPENKFESILREWDEELIEINNDKNACKISGKNSSFAINCETDTEQFPSSPQFPDEGYLEIDPLIINEMIKRTVFVVIAERIRYTLSGVLFNVDGNKIEMVSTDGRRLSKVKKTIDNPNGIKCSCIIPVKGLVQLDKAISSHFKVSDKINTENGGEKLKIKVEENRVLFKAANFILSVQLIEGDYPDYEKIIPKESNFEALLDSNRLKSSVKRAAVVTNDGSKLVKFLFDNNKLLLTAEVSEVGNSKVEMDVIYGAERFEIGFNPDFINDALNVVDNSTVKMKFIDQGKAGVINEELSDGSNGNEDDGFLHVVMPINLKNEDEETESEDKPVAQEDNEYADSEAANYVDSGEENSEY